MQRNTVADMQAISVKKMRELEEKAFSRGTTVLELMEAAGKECARIIGEKLGKGKRIFFFCGPGNNGGDGLVCARYLSKNNKVIIVMPLDPKTDAAKRNFGILEKEKTGVMARLRDAEKLQCDIAVDALLGIGAKGALRGPIKNACRFINSLEAFKVSIDIPTGMDADSGSCDSGAVRPDATICIHAPKKGEINAGKEKTGELWVADIGL